MVQLVYLDYNCFQRTFDDQSQIRIRMESLACEAIFEKAENEQIRLVWSFIHHDENAECPFLDRKAEIIKLSELCKVVVPPRKEIATAAREIQGKYRVSAKDALHLASALDAKVRVFVTCDDEVKKKTGGRIGEMVIINPTEYIMEI